MSTAHSLKLKLTVGDRVVTATLIDSPTTRDFLSQLPLSLTMEDLFGKEKFARLPQALSTAGTRTNTVEVGDLGYWSPSSDVAIYYRTDGEKIPSPGIILIGKIDSAAEAFQASGSVKVKIEFANE